MPAADHLGVEARALSDIADRDAEMRDGFDRDHRRPPRLHRSPQPCHCERSEAISRRWATRPPDKRLLPRSAPCNDIAAGRVPHWSSAAFCEQRNTARGNLAGARSLSPASSRFGTEQPFRAALRNEQVAPEADIVKNCLALTRPSKGRRLLEAAFDNASPPGGSAVQFANGGFSLHWRLAGPHHSPRMDVRPLCSQCRHAIEPRLRRLEFGGER